MMRCFRLREKSVMREEMELLEQLRCLTCHYAVERSMMASDWDSGRCGLVLDSGDSAGVVSRTFCAPLRS
jgi:hypothetical protein